MNRRAFLASATMAATAAPAPRPNFLFLIADDLTFNGIQAMGNAEVATPNLDRLIRRGCSFTHCFHQGSWTGAASTPKNESVFCWYRDFQRSVRTRGHKLIVYPQAKRIQLFDMKKTRRRPKIFPPSLVMSRSKLP